MSTVATMEKMTTALQTVNTTVKPYLMQTGNLSTATERLTQSLYADTEPGASDVYVVVICRLDCLIQLLEQVRTAGWVTCVCRHTS